MSHDEILETVAKKKIDTAKWIWDSSILSSIKPKIDIELFVIEVEEKKSFL